MMSKKVSFKKFQSEADDPTLPPEQREKPPANGRSSPDGKKGSGGSGRRYFRDMLARIRKGRSGSRVRESGGEVSPSSFVSAVLENTHPFSGEDRGGEGGRGRRRKRPSTRRQMRVVAPGSGDPFWGKAGSLEVIGIKSVISSRNASQGAAVPDLSPDGGQKRSRSREILDLLHQKLEYMRNRTVPTGRPGSLRAARSLAEMSTLVSELGGQLLVLGEKADAGSESGSSSGSGDGRDGHYRGADRVDEDVVVVDGGQVEEEDRDHREVKDVVNEIPRPPVPDVCQTDTTSQQTTPYGIPHFADGDVEAAVSVEDDPVLGHGSFSTVHRGTFHHTPVAVKVFKEGRQDSFETERDILLHLRHPNVVQLLATCERQCPSGTNRWLVLELLAGGSLRDHLEVVGDGMPPGQVLSVAADLCSAVAHLHCLPRPILHLDIKSGNVLLDPGRKRALLCDFGLSRRLQGSDSTVLLGGAKGTPAWMPPEVIGNSRVGLPADVFGFGMVLWEMFSGSRPYDGLDLKEVCDCILLGSLPPLSPLYDLNVPGVRDLIGRCWAEAPGDRPAAREVLDELRRMREGLREGDRRRRFRRSETLDLSSAREDLGDISDFLQAAAEGRPPKGRRRRSLGKGGRVGPGAAFQRSKSLVAIPSPRKAPPLPHGTPPRPFELMETALQITPKDGNPVAPRVPKIGFRVTPMELARQRSQLKSHPAETGGEEPTAGPAEVEPLTGITLRAVLARRRKDMAGGGGRSSDEASAPSSPWSVGTTSDDLTA